MKFKILQIFLIFVLVLGFGLPAFSLFLKASEDLEAICQLDKLEGDCESLSSTDCRALLEKCESYFQEKSDRIAQDISKTEAEKNTLKNQISVLSNKITNLNYQISQNNIMIKDLSLQVDDTKASIDKTTLRIEESKKQLAEVLREVYDQDQKSTIEILIGNEELSDFFENLTALESLNEKNQELLENIKSLKASLEGQKESLDNEKGELEKTVELQILQKTASDKNKKDQEYFLKLTESEYQKYLKEKADVEKQASEIRSRIFELIGVVKAPTFGEAVELAKSVEKITGIRPAFLLAILTQESNIGQNVGQCFLKNTSNGSGVNSKGDLMNNIMKPSRDIQPFLTITRELGRDPLNTAVSCPIKSVGGYGGAMGPAQFIPSTWMAYRDRLKEINGRPADPWDIKDSFLAAALYLTDYGAAKKTSDAEWRAAMIYFSGSTNSKYRFYGDSVIALAKKYQSDINLLNQ